MRENKVHSVWKSGAAVINGWLTIPNSWSAEVMANQGMDSLTIDMQHGLMDYQTAFGMLQAISTTAVAPLVRVNWNEPGIIMKMLDAGAYGIICPMVNNRVECEAFVGACRYYPQGYRSVGPTRATVYAGNDYETYANQMMITLAMIETRQAMDNLDEIMSVPGLDGIYVGPNDLSLSMDLPERANLTEPQTVTLLDKILAATKRHGIKAGIHTRSADAALLMIEKGFQFVTVMTDTSLLANAASEVVKAARPYQANASSPKLMY